MEKTPGNDDVENILKSAKSHLQRAREGRDLLKKGRPLSEMTTPIEGPSDEYLLSKRKIFIDGLQDKDKESLNKLLHDTDERILQISKGKIAGYSDLLWQRTVILEKLGEL